MVTHYDVVAAGGKVGARATASACRAVLAAAASTTYAVTVPASEWTVPVDRLGLPAIPANHWVVNKLVHTVKEDNLPKMILLQQWRRFPDVNIS